MSEGEIGRSLDNVLTRLALTSEETLSTVLWKLFPAVLRQLKHPGDVVRSGVLKILAHANKRLEGREEIQLPLVDLVVLLHEADEQGQPLVRSLTLVYIEKAVHRSTAEARRDAFPGLLSGIARRPKEQRTILLRTGLAALEDAIPQKPPTESNKVQKTENVAFAFLTEEAGRKLFLEFAVWMLLFQNKERIPSRLEIMHEGQVVELPLEVQSTLSSVPPGLSLELAQSIQGKETWTEQRLIKRKEKLLEFLKEANLGMEAFLPYLVASADASEPVSKLGEQLMKKYFRIEADSKDIDLNNPELVCGLIDLFRGSVGTSGPPTQETLSAFRLPASHSLKSKILSVLAKSIQAANLYPNNIHVVWSCVFGVNVPTSLRLQAMEFSVWVIKHANASTLSQLAEPMLEELLEMLKGGAKTTQRGYVYDALGQLAQRRPSIFHGKVHVAEDLFAALESEPSVFKDADEETVVTVKELILNAVTNNSSAVRMAAVTWAIRLFPFEDVAARFVCVVGAGDDRSEVRTEAKFGLHPNTLSKEAMQLRSNYPTVPEFLLFLKTHSLMVQDRLHRSDAVYEVLIEFLKNCHEASSASVLDAASLSALLGYYGGAWREGTSDRLAATAFEAAVELLHGNVDAVADWVGNKLSMIKRWLYHTSNAVRIPAARLIGVSLHRLPTEQARTLIQELSYNLKPSAKSKFEVKNGSLRAIGYTTVGCRDDRAVEWATITVEDVEPLLNGDPHLASVASTCLSHQLLRPGFFDVLRDVYAQGVNTKAFEAWFSDDVLASVFQLCSNNDLTVATEAVYAIGWISKGLEQPRHQAQCLKHLVGLQTIKNEELQCTIGEALSFGFAKETLPNTHMFLSNFTSLRKLDIDFQELPVPQGTDVHADIVDALLKGLTHSRVENRAACVGHLVALMTYCPRHPSILARLESAQQAFLGLLGDRNPLTQEMASRGVSLVYALGDETTKSKLLNGLTGVLKSPTQKGPSVKIEGDTELFAEGELGTIPGGGRLTTYKELCSLATDMGQPEMMYKFMNIANHRTALQSRHGAAVGFAHIAEIASEDLKPHLPTLLPRIYRLRFDPNPSVQETMHNIWKCLVPDDIAEIGSEIVKELLREIVSRLWRHRESSCRGLIDWLQGKPWSQVHPYLEEIWTKAFRAADDIKQSVRSAGVDLLKTLNRITLRFADPHVSDTSVIEETVRMALPIMLNVIKHSTVTSVVAVAFGTLSTLAASCPPELLRPHLGLLVPALLVSHSSMESGILNELQLQMSGAGLDSEKIEHLSIQAASHSPIQDILNRCVRVMDKASLTNGDLTSSLKNLIRSGVGLNTRVATVNFVKQMVMHLGKDSASHAAPFLGTLLSKSLSGESSGTIKKAHASTIGALCSVVSIKATGKAVEECLKAFRSDRTDHQTIALIFLEIHRQAPEHFSAYATSIIPIAFVYRFESGTTSLWETVLEEGMGTEHGAVRLYHKEMTQVATAALECSRWSARAAGAQSFERMFRLDAAVMESQTEAILKLLLLQLSGRAWDGKEAVLQAVSAICAQLPSSVQDSASTIVDAELLSCKKGKKIYRETALKALSESVLHLNASQEVYNRVVPFLLSTTKERLKSVDSHEETEEALPWTSLLDCLANVSRSPNLSPQSREDAESLTLFTSALSSPHPWHLKLSAVESLVKYLKGATLDADSISNQIAPLLQGVFVCLEEVKYEKLRLKSIEALDIISPYIKSHHGVVDRLKGRRDSERSLTVQRSIDALIEKLRS